MAVELSYCGIEPQRGQAAGNRRAGLAGHAHVLDDRDLREDVGDLERLGHAFPVEEDGLQAGCVTGVKTCAFFFSSRRRHTRSLCDWSSDVCSSDLNGVSTANFAKSKLAPAVCPRMH